MIPKYNVLTFLPPTGTLIQYVADKSELIEVKLAKHVVAKGGHRAPNAVKSSKDSRLIAFVGPSEHCVSVLSAQSLDCLLKLDISSAVASCLDSAQSVTFGTVCSRDLFVCTTSGKVIRYSLIWHCYQIQCLVTLLGTIFGYIVGTIIGHIVLSHC